MNDIPMEVTKWRELAAKGELDRDMMRAAVALLRADRKMSVESQAARKEPKVKVTKVQSLLDSFATQMSEGKDES